MPAKPTYEELELRVKELELRTEQRTSEISKLNEELMSDIAEHKRTEEMLREAEETYRNIFCNSQIGLFRTDIRTGYLLDANDTVARFIGYKDRNDLLDNNKSFNIAERYVNPDDRKRMISLLEAHGEFADFETRYRRNDGLVIWMRFSGKLVVEKGWLEGVSEDITERKIAEEALKESEERYRMIAENTSDSIWILDLETMRLSYASPSVKKVTGYTVEEQLNRPFDKIIEPEAQDRLMKVLSDGLKRHAEGQSDEEITERLEWQEYHKDGHLIWIEAETAFIKDDNGKPTGIIGVSRDITDRKKTEEALKETKERYKSISDSSLNMIYLYDLQGNIIDANKAALEFTGYDFREFISLNFSEILYSGDIPKGLATMERILKSGFDDELDEYQLKTKQGDVKYIEARGSVIYKDNQPFAIQGIALDITDRKKAEEDLKKRNEFIELILDNLPIGLAVNSMSENKISYINKKFEEIYGWPKEYYADLESFFECVYPNPNYRQLIAERIIEDIASGDLSRMNWNNIQAMGMNGEKKIVKATNIPLYDQDLMISTVRDDTSRYNAINELKISEDRFKNLFNYMTDGVAIYKAINDGEDFIFLDINSAGERISATKREDVIGQSILEKFPNVKEIGLFEVFQKVLETGKSMYHPISMYKDERLEQWVSNMVYKIPSGEIIAIYHDETNRKKSEEERLKLESQLRQAEKMQSIGTLAGGIAHDFNNILSIILGNTELALDDTPDWNPTREYLAETRTASLRAKDLVQQLLTFTRKSEQNKKPIKISTLAKESIKLLRSSIPTNIDINQSISENLHTIKADSTQMHQVLMNLIANSAHAIEGSGIIDIELENVTIDQSQIALVTELQSGDYVRLTVNDSGSGIEPQDLGKVFDPYFTTREFGKGTGMGLSLVHGIVKSHEGSIQVSSKLGQGTTITIYFPASEDFIEPEQTEESDLPVGTERILIVDDEESLAKLCQIRLERHGYTVEYRTDPLEALELIKSNPDQFGLVITDMAMPKMTGAGLASDLKKFKQNLPVILCTGYSDKIDEDKAKDIGIKAFLMKPVDAKILADAVRRVLDKG
jgi:PAS domain S-box-containing protein